MSGFISDSYLQHMLIQTLLRHFPVDVVVGAEFERKVTQMIGCDPNGHHDDVSLVVGSRCDASAILSAGFVGTWVGIAESISADSTLSMISKVLNLEQDDDEDEGP